MKNFVETKLETHFGPFNFRVYADGKETVVLWTDHCAQRPALVRVHSECMTGDVFGSLHCDCGQQLAESLSRIGKEGGVVIYLRQEGRGIGLFEKIKSYRLQAQGIDTFEANVRLGHHPDSRSYGKIKTILDDLQIDHVRLLTNNPCKIAELARAGVQVERVPLISKPNRHNRAYLKTKREKFFHLLGGRDETL
jgi:3,4-dihydroxy 2-butanone 4-phosphate synthase / GTP cyclohydrolase II